MQQPSSSPLPRWLGVPLAAWLVTRLIVCGVIFAADAVLPGFNDTTFFTGDSVAGDWVRAWQRWDGVWYEQIAVDGYRYEPGADRNTVAFFPLYPLAMRALLPLTGGHAILAGLIISHGAFLAALMAIFALARRLTGDEAASARAVWYLAATPYALFFSAVYSESLFLLLTALACLAAESALDTSAQPIKPGGRWLIAGSCAALASATRPTGLLLLIPFAWLWLRDSRRDVRHLSSGAGAVRGLPPALPGAAFQVWLRPDVNRMGFLALLLVPVGLLAYMHWQSQTYGDALAFAKAQSGWRQSPGLQPIINDLTYLIQGRLWPSYILDTVVLFAALLSLPLVWRRVGGHYALYCLAALLIPASSGVMSITRFTLVLFPLFIALGLAGRRKWLHLLIIVSGLALQPIFTLFFVKWVFLG